jgi:hypothetical protein
VQVIMDAEKHTATTSRCRAGEPLGPWCGGTIPVRLAFSLKLEQKMKSAYTRYISVIRFPGGVSILLISIS